MDMYLFTLKRQNIKAVEFTTGEDSDEIALSATIAFWPTGL